MPDHSPSSSHEGSRASDTQAEGTKTKSSKVTTKRRRENYWTRKPVQSILSRLYQGKRLDQEPKSQRANDGQSLPAGKHVVCTANSRPDGPAASDTSQVDGHDETNQSGSKITVTDDTQRETQHRSRKVKSRKREGAESVTADKPISDSSASHKEHPNREKPRKRGGRKHGEDRLTRTETAKSQAGTSKTAGREGTVGDTPAGSTRQGTARSAVQGRTRKASVETVLSRSEGTQLGTAAGEEKVSRVGQSTNGDHPTANMGPTEGAMTEVDPAQFDQGTEDFEGLSKTMETVTIDDVTPDIVDTPTEEESTASVSSETPTVIHDL